MQAVRSGDTRRRLPDDLDEGHRVLVQVAASGCHGSQRVEDDHQDGHHQGHHPQNDAEDTEGQHNSYPRGGTNDPQRKVEVERESGRIPSGSSACA